MVPWNALRLGFTCFTDHASSSPLINFAKDVTHVTPVMATCKGASFQITMRDGDGLQAYMGGLGTGVVTSILVPWLP